MRDDEAYVAFVSARWASLYRIAHLLTGDRTRAEDLLQAALLKAYVAWRRVEASAAPEAYVRAILTNAFVSERRKRWVRSEISHGDVPERAVEAADHSVLERSDMWERLQALPPKQRAVVVLRYYEDLTEQQIADTLGCSVGTVKSQASDALRSLRKTFSTNEATGPGTESRDGRA